MVDERERQAIPTSPSMVHSNRGTDILGTAVKNSPHQKVFRSTKSSSWWRHPPESIRGEIYHQKHFLATLVLQKSILCFMHINNNDSYPSSTSNRANGQHVVVSQRDTTHQNTLFLIPDRPKNRYRKWISCRSGCGGLHQFSPHVNRSSTWLHPLINCYLHGGGVICTDTPSAS